MSEVTKLKCDGCGKELVHAQEHIEIKAMSFAKWAGVTSHETSRAHILLIKNGRSVNSSPPSSTLDFCNDECLLKALRERS